MFERSVDLNPYTILVVEGHPLGLKDIRVALEKAGYAVLEARDGRHVLELMTQHPDLIIVDLVLSDIDGFNLIQKIRSLPGGVDVPIIAYTGVMTGAEEARSIEVGCTDYLFKPITTSHLLETIDTYLPPKDGLERIGTGERVLVVDDDPIHLSLVKTRLEHAGFGVVGTSDATEALTRAHQSPPDLILSDVLMPQMDGFQFCLAVRKDAKLSHVPVLLYSSAYNEEVDRQLAREVGANDLVIKDPGFQSVVAAISLTLGVTPPPATAISDGLGADYTRRLAQQLDRQMMVNTSIRQRLMRREAELAVLSTFLDALRHGSVDGVLEELLTRTLHAVGVVRGVIFLMGADGTLQPRVQLGFPQLAYDGVADLFGHARVLHRAIEEGIPAVVPLRMPRGILHNDERPEQSALIAPLLHDNKRLGVLAMMCGTRALTEELFPFARTVGAQIGQVLGIIHALGDQQGNVLADLPAG
ncbi:MAG TPA: response regulator [bacterium]|nr:response regulator [bacterium]